MPAGPPDEPRSALAKRSVLRAKGLNNQLRDLLAAGSDDVRERGPG
jgi:hypothetical protein